MSTNSTFLKEMGITEWTTREAPPVDSPISVATELVRQPGDALAITSTSASLSPVASESLARPSLGTWWFFGAKPQGEADLLFQSIIRVLGLMPQEWSWKNPATPFDPKELPQDGSPIVALAFGGATAQKLSGERDGLPELRETVLALNADGAEDLPLIATFELNQLLARPKDKALFWQDLVLAKSVLQNS